MPCQRTHNNDIERDHRGVAIGRKNWLFIGSEAAGVRAATRSLRPHQQRHLGPSQFLPERTELVTLIEPVTETPARRRVRGAWPQFGSGDFGSGD